MVRSFQKTGALTPEVKSLQDATDRALRPLTKCSLVGGRLIKDVEISTGTPLLIDHKLGRDPYWIVVGKSAEADVWDSQASNDTPKRTLVLNASADVTVQLWVF